MECGESSIEVVRVTNCRQQWHSEMGKARNRRMFQGEKGSEKNTVEVDFAVEIETNT